MNKKGASYLILVLMILIYNGIRLDVFSQIHNEQNKSFAREPFSFLSDDQKTTIHGEIVLPNTSQISTCPFIIFVQPPAIPLDKDYFGTFKALADSFAEKGIISLRMENRSKANSSYESDSLNSAMEAEDLYCAIVSVKKDKRFENSRIGLLGHSEGSNAIVKEIHKHGQPAFIVLLSPMGLNGNDFAFHQMKSALLKFARNNVDSSVTSFLNYLEEILSFEYKYQNNFRTLNIKFKEIVSEMYARGGFGKQTKEEAYRRSKKDFLNPRFLDYVQFNPALYFSSITCPALILYGKEDERLDYKPNSRNIDSLFRANHKTNYKIVSFDGVNHDFKNKYDNEVVDEKVMDVMIEWITTVYRKN